MKERTLRQNLNKITLEERKAHGLFKEDIPKLKLQLEIIDEEHYRGALVRARAKRLAMRETPTKRALGIEKARARRNTIDEIKCNGRAPTQIE